jgi:sensory rhodopsin
VTVLETTDIAGATFSLVLLGMAATTVLMLLATGWVSGRWKIPVALCALVTLVGTVNTWDAREVWLATRQIPIVYQYVGWMITVPVQVAALYFFVRAMGRTSVALFWRLLVVAAVTILARYMGEAGFMHPTLGFLIGIAGWLYILGEAFFGRMGEVIAKSDDEGVQRGYFWIRLIVTIGWAVYPLGNFISSFAGGVDSGSLAVTYNLADFVNRIAFAMAILTVAINHTYPAGGARNAGAK